MAMISASKWHALAACGPRTAVVVLGVITLVMSQFGTARAELMHFTVDPVASEISAAVSEPMASLRGVATGKFRIVSGEIVSDSASPARTTSVKLVVDAASYSSGTSLRDRAVTGSTLQAQEYPTITFQGGDVDNIVRVSETSGTATIRGSLTLHGATRVVIVPISVQLTGDTHLQADGAATINYPDWGIAPPSMLFGSMRAGDQATIRFHIVARAAS